MAIARTSSFNCEPPSAFEAPGSLWRTLAAYLAAAAMRLALRLVAPLSQQLDQAGKLGVGKILHRRMVRFLDESMFVGAQRPSLFLA